MFRSCQIIIKELGVRLQDAHQATAPQHIPTQHDILPQHLVCKYQLNCEYYNTTLARN